MRIYATLACRKLLSSHFFSLLKYHSLVGKFKKWTLCCSSRTLCNVKGEWEKIRRIWQSFCQGQKSDMKTASSPDKLDQTFNFFFSTTISNKKLGKTSILQHQKRSEDTVCPQFLSQKCKPRTALTHKIQMSKARRLRKKTALIKLCSSAKLTFSSSSIGLVLSTISSCD